MNTTAQKRSVSLITLLTGIVFCFCAFCNAGFVTAQDDFLPDFFSDGYAGGTYTQTQTDEVIYEYKTENKQSLGTSFPDYYNMSSQLINCCANVAGANVIGYYDRFYDNLIPDYTPGIARGNSFSYYPMSLQSEKKQAVIEALYSLMGTNTVENGTSYDQYKQGFDSYVASKGRTATHTSVMTGGNLDLVAMSGYIAAGQPVVMFLSGYNIASFTEQEGRDTWTKLLYSGNHMMVAYEIIVINYYNASDQLIATRTMMGVATGFNDAEKYYIVDSNSVIIDAEAIAIN